MKGGRMNAWLRQVKMLSDAKGECCSMQREQERVKNGMLEYEGVHGWKASFCAHVNKLFLSEMCMQMDFFLINTRALLCHEFINTNGAFRVSLI